MSKHENIQDVVDPNDDLIDADELRKLRGGKKRPISKATLYRLIKAKAIPPGIRVAPNVVRFSRKEQQAAIAELFAAE